MTTARGIDFNTLSLQDALDLAILIEEEAKDRYEELAAELMELDKTPPETLLQTEDFADEPVAQ